MSDYERSTVSTIKGVNAETQKIQTAVNSKMDKSGGAFTGTVDMNEQRLINLPNATDPSEAMPLGQGLAIQGAAEDARDDAQQFAENAASSATQAAVSEAVAAAVLAQMNQFPVEGALAGAISLPGSEVLISGQQAKKYFATFDTVAGAQSAITTDYVGRRIQWLGYHVLSDGGSGWGIVKSGAYTADGGSVIAVGPSLYIEQTLKGSSQNVRKWGAKGDGITDDTQAFKNAIAYVSASGGLVYVPEGMYKIIETIYLPSGVTLEGAGSFQATVSLRYGATALFCSHTGPAMVSMKGSNGCGLKKIALVGDQLNKPKTGLCLGRSTSASAGHHQIDNISITGWFTVSAIYSIASEENEMRKVFTWNFGGDAPYGLVSSTHDIFNVDSLVTSTNLHNLYSNVVMYVTSELTNSAGIFLQTSNDMGNFKFDNCYIVLNEGAYVRINSGDLDGDAAFGPITLNNVSGEPLSGGAPKIGLQVTASVPVLLAGLSATGCRFQLPANTGGNIYDVFVDDNVTLLNPNIIIQPPEAFPYAFSQIPYNKVRGGIVSVGRDYEWKTLTLESPWVNNFGSPYALASYRIDPSGRVHFRGDIGGSTASLIGSIPTKYWPPSNVTFISGSDKLLLNTAGQLIHLSGPATSVALSSVSFDMN